MPYLFNFIILGTALLVFFYLLYLLGGDTIVFFRRKIVQDNPKAGEAVSQTLRRFAALRGAKVIGPVTLYKNGEGVTFDAILVGTFGIFAAKAIGLSGEIYGDMKEPTILQVLEEERYTLPSPFVQASLGAKLLREALVDAKIRLQVLDTACVFTEKKVLINLPQGPQCMRLSALASNIDKARYLTDNGVDVDAVLAKIDAASQKDSIE